MTYDALLRSALQRTMKCDRETEATKLLLMETSDLGAARFYASLKEDVPKDVLELFETRLEQYLSHDIPIQHLLGHAWFYGYTFIVTPDVLIPRSETEGLVAQALMVIDDLGDRPIKVLDLGCGSGCIGLSIKKEAPAARQGVNTHPMRIVTMVLLLMAPAPFTRPTPITAPTMAEEVDTGMPRSEKRCSPPAEAAWATRARGISRGVIPFPTVSATFLP